MDREGPYRIRGSGGKHLAFPLPTWPQGVCWAPRLGPLQFKAPSGHMGTRGVGGREVGERGGEADSGGGTLQDQRIRGDMASYP